MLPTNLRFAPDDLYLSKSPRAYFYDGTVVLRSDHGIWVLHPLAGDGYGALSDQSLGLAPRLHQSRRHQKLLDGNDAGASLINWDLVGELFLGEDLVEMGGGGIRNT